MSNEITVTCSFSVRKTSDQISVVDYQRTRTNQIDMDGAKGPVPGALTVSPLGTFIDLSQLSTPGVAWITALFTDTENYVEIGLYDVTNNVFAPLIELRAGQAWPLNLSRNLLEESSGTGTSTGPPNNKLMARAWSTAADISFEAFEK